MRENLAVAFDELRAGVQRMEEAAEGGKIASVREALIECLVAIAKLEYVVTSALPFDASRRA